MTSSPPSAPLAPAPGSESFPRRHARTRRFTLGAPRSLTLTPDGARVVFLRSRGGTDPVTCLWLLDLTDGRERLVADADALTPGGADDVPAEERARRERAREQAGGIVGYGTDRAGTVAAFALAGRLFVADLADGATPREIDGTTAVVDPRPDPTGRRVAFCSGGALHVHDLATATTTTVAAPEGDHQTVGLADFAAAEEMNRFRGYWWSPDGERLAVVRVDTAAVPRWHIADPENPDRPAVAVAYPAAGTTNAALSVEIVAATGGPAVVVDHREEYLADVRWDEHGLFLVDQPRDQRALAVHRVDPDIGATDTVHTQTDPTWVDLIGGVPVHLSSGALLTVAAHGETLALCVDGTPVTPPSLLVRDVLDVDTGPDGDTVLLRGHEHDSWDIGLWTWHAEHGLVPRSAPGGVHTGRLSGGTLAVVRSDLDTDGSTTTVTRLGSAGPDTVITSHAAAPGLVPSVALSLVGERRLPTALLLPTGHVPGTRLPVLMDPYGGPHAQRVLSARSVYLTSQWFADRGFAVIVTDGRGTPGRGPQWERAVHHDLAGPVLDDQVDALHALAAQHPDLDLSRVAIRGWSFGGYLAALAVLRRPDVFRAGIAGAPVTDWRLYDTHYTERYLGQPDADPQVYQQSSLIEDAPTLERPLMLIHGLADDNVVAAHTLRLSSALLSAGRPHTVLPLSGVTHMTPQEVVAENLLLLQVRFLADSLGVTVRD